MYVYVHIGNDKPTMKLLNKYRGKIALHWYDLGIELLEEKYISQLHIIRKNNPVDIESSCCELFEYWLSVDMKASWNKVIDALEEIGQNTIADEIKQDVFKGNYISNIGIHICHKPACT